MRQAAGGCKQFASSAFVGDNGGVSKSKSVPGCSEPTPYELAKLTVALSHAFDAAAT
jgi:hypothetical protein